MLCEITKLNFVHVFHKVRELRVYSGTPTVLLFMHFVSPPAQALVGNQAINVLKFKPAPCTNEVPLSLTAGSLTPFQVGTL